MAHLQYMPGDPRLVDQLVYELKSKGIFDQFRKDCIADVDTRPAYQNLRQRVESSVSTFLSRQCWQPDLNKNQLREKLRKHILDGNYLEQGVERIVDQVVNPKVASVFIPQVEELVYNYLGITRKKATPETSCEKTDDLLPTDLEAVSPGSVKSNDDKNEAAQMDTSVTEDSKMEVDSDEPKPELKGENSVSTENVMEVTELDIKLPDTNKGETSNQDFIELDCNIPMPTEDIKVENIPPPQGSPPKIDLEKNNKELIVSTDIPLPDEIPKDAKENFFKPINSDEDDSSSDSSLRRNMSPLTPIRNFMNENSCDAQQAFENDSDSKGNEKKEPSTFRFAIEAKSPENSSDALKTEKKEGDKEQANLTYRFNNQININNFNTPLYEDSSNSNNLQIDYESDANSKAILEAKNAEDLNLEDSKKDRKPEERKSSHKSSHRSRDSSRHSSSKDKRSDSKPSSSRDSSRHDKKYSRDENNKSKSSHKDKSSDRSEKKDSDKKDKDSKHRSSSHRSSSHKDSKSHKSSNSSSSQRHSSKHSEEKKSSSSHKDKSEKISDRSSDKSSKDRSKDSKSSSHRSDKDRKSSSSSNKSSKNDEKDKDKKSKKESDDHYSLSGRGNSNRRSTDRDSNDGSSSSKGSHNPTSSKSSGSQVRDSKSTSSKSDNASPSGESTSPSDKDNAVLESNSAVKDGSQSKPVVRIDTRLENPIASPPRLPFVPDVTLKKPKFAANLQEAKKLMKMRRFLDEEQKRMNQEAALLLEFQANVRPSLSQVYSSIPGPELEFACVINNDQPQVLHNNPVVHETTDDKAVRIPSPTTALLAVVNAQNIEELTGVDAELSNITEISDTKETNKSCDETTQDSEPMSVITEDDAVDITKAAETNVPDTEHEIEEIKETIKVPESDDSETEEIEEQKSLNAKELEVLMKLEMENENKRTEYFEVIVIAEELSESEESQSNIIDDLKTETNSIDVPLEIDKDLEKEIKSSPVDNNNTVIEKSCCSPVEEQFRFFAENEKYNAELERDRFTKFFKSYSEKDTNNKVYLINCDTYEESILKEVLETFGDYEIVNYHRNGHLELPKASKNIVKNVNLAVEVSLPFDNNEFETAVNELEMDLKATRPAVLSPVKSECSFDLSNDYDAKLDEMVNKTSRQEIMEIILGNALSNESPSKMPKIDYFTESCIDDQEVNLKRKLEDVETVNNNRPVLTPKKIRKMSASDQITSTTEEDDDRPISRLQNSTRSKYLGRARRVGLPKPRRSDQPNSPSSDKSVENYEQNTAIEPTPNGKIKTPQRTKFQRYDTSELYKPKLHYLSRRNNIS